MNRSSILLFLSLLLIVVPRASCSLNLYINRTESKKILGIEGDIYYIRDGQVKLNAVNFNMTVPSRVDCLRFIWYSKRIPSKPMGYYYYTLKLRSFTPDLLVEPKVNIEQLGPVPETKKEFCVNMTCSGTKDGTAHMLIQINITSKERQFVLNLRRIKSCRKAAHVDKTITKPTVSQQRAGADVDPPVSPMDKTKVFYIAVGVACSIIFIIALAVAAIHVHSMPNANSNKDGASESEAVGGQQSLSKTPLITTAEQPKQVAVNAVGNNGVQNGCPPNANHIPVKVEIQAGPTANSLTRNMPTVLTILNGDVPHVRPRIPGGFPVRDSTISITPSDGYYSAGGLQSTQKGKYGNRDMKAELKDLEVEMDRITLGDLLEEGTFARIYNGVLTGPGEGQHQQQSVLVKTVSGMASADQVNLLLIESSMLKDLTHRNLLPVMAVCLEDEKQPLVMFPFMNRGNLKLFIKKSRSPEGGSKSLTTADLVHVGIQIAKGLQYLARRRIVHKDIAARNCVIDDDLNVKVTDCALSRDLFPQDYCCLGDNENRPVKWMAVESLEQGRYTVASDVWAYGVTLWELMTLGQQPYGNIDAFEMLNFLKQGHRISQPVNCPDELFTVIACCWALSEDERPGFGQMIVCLTDFLNALSNFI